jgi:tetratricopeptide (TPR) repeat protein
MAGPNVFLSYSHDSDAHDARVLALSDRLIGDGLDCILDQYEPNPPEGWSAWMDRQLDEADFVLVVCTEGYYRKAKAGMRPTSGRGVKFESVLIVNDLYEAAMWNERFIPVLFEDLPGDLILRPLRGYARYRADEEKGYEALLRHLTAQPAHPRPAPGAIPNLPPLSGASPPAVEPGGRASPLLDLGRLPIPGPQFVGRKKEMERLDAAWEDGRTHVLTLVAFGGVGKSALVARWMDRMAADGWRGAERVLDWSFYSQGMEDRVTSAETFIDYALRFCEDKDPIAGSLHDRGARLARLVGEKRTLLVLDGIEPLQYPLGRPEIEGRLKDPGLKALLKGLAAGNTGLCVVTTRERVADLAGSPTTAPQVDLEDLEVEVAVALLRQLGVDGREKELRAAAQDFHRHALTLTLLGNFLRRAWGGDVRRRKEIGLHRADAGHGGKASRVIAAYARWLGRGKEVAILRLLGLFDRPADRASLKALRTAPSIPGLTEPLVGLSDEDWNLAVATLREHGLLLAADKHEPETLDAHPLVRAHFAEELETRSPNAWQEGNRRLYEHLCKAAPEFPDTLEAMQPLFASVVHGSRAGRQQEVMDEVFSPRIRRGREHFSVNKLGGWGSDLTALAGFFDRPWSQPSGSLTAADQAFVLNEAAFDLRALGRLAEAVEPMAAGLEALRRSEDWERAAAAAGNLSELTLTLGDVPRAVAFGEQSVELADRSGDAFQRMGKRTTWADALHQAGLWEESASAFREAEAMQAERQPQYPRLYSLQGFQYCDLLLSRAEPESGGGLDGLSRRGPYLEEAERYRWVCREVLERASQTLGWALTQGFLLDIALDHLTLGRAHLGLALTAPESAPPGENRNALLAQAAESLARAVDGLRRAGQDQELPRGLLARAAFHRLRSDFPAATADLTEVLEIAERGPMRLHECDAHLEWARLCRDQGDLSAARRHLARARALVEQTGYKRREREVAWLEKALFEATPAGTPTTRGALSPQLLEAASMTKTAPRFRIALSFPGEHRALVERVADLLASSVGRDRVLYDKFYEAEFARVDLDVYLPRLYREDSELIVLFLCAEYAAKRWCRLEWRHIRQLLATVAEERIMLLSVGPPGDTSGLGILPGDGYVDVAGRSPEAIAELVLQRLNGAATGSSSAPPPPPPERPATVAGAIPPASRLLEQLNQLSAAQFEGLVFRFDLDSNVPGRTEAQSVRAIELLKVLRSRDGGLLELASALQRVARGGGPG